MISTHHGVTFHALGVSSWAFDFELNFDLAHCDWCRFLLNPHFHLKIVKIDEYYHIFHENQYVQLHLPQIHPSTCSHKAPV